MVILILAGGIGSRLFPLSTKDHPKPFLRLANGNSLLKQTINRFITDENVKKIVICTHQDYKDLVESDICSLKKKEKCEILLEPQRKNTLAAITFALYHLKKEKEPIFVVPIDHSLSPENILLERMNAISKVLQENQIVCFGVSPKYPETEYGYLHKGKKICSLLSELTNFTEKPDLQKAQQYVLLKTTLWNMGILGFFVRGFYKQLLKYQPTYAKMFQIEEKTIPQFYDKLPDLSVDQGLLQNCKSLYCTELDLSWIDIGSYSRFFKSNELIKK